MEQRDWHFQRDGRQWGPVTTAELREMLEVKDLSWDAPVRREGMSEWSPARAVPDLTGEAAVATDLASASSPHPVAATVLEYARPQVEYAGFIHRLFAIIADGVILGVSVTLLQLLFESLLSHNHADRPADVIAGWAIAWLYFASMESSRGATLGKMLVGIEVTDLAGQRISFPQATGRFFAKLLSMMIFYIGFLMAAFTQKKQALHDMIAGTLVIRRPPKAGLE